MDKIKKVFRCILRNFLMRIQSSRFWVSMLLLLLLVYAFSNGMRDFLQDYQMNISIWISPHFFSTFLFVAYYGFVVCYMYSDVPFMSRSELYWLLREGRYFWCIGKIGAIILQGIVAPVVTMTMGLVVLMPYLSVQKDWGTAIYTMAYSQKIIMDYNIWSVPSSTIIEKYSPIEAVLLCLFLISIVTCTVGVMMFSIGLNLNRIVAVVTGLLLANLQLSLNYIPQWMALYYVSPYTWMLLGALGEKSIGINRYPTLTYVLIASTVLFIVSGISTFLRLKKLEFIWYKED